MLREITKDYRFGTYGVFKPCKVPKREPDYTSQSGSRYWYGENKRGKYMIRFSDHWSRIFYRGRWKDKKTIRKISKSIWLLKSGYCGKINISHLSTIY